ncbi:hypothetical protein ACHQM5_028345 [Ranunculus cassubicifolius]
MSPFATQTADSLIQRPPSNYKPSIWGHEYLMKTLKNEFEGEAYTRRAATLQDGVRQILGDLYSQMDSMALLELIEDIQRLGLGYIFEKDIQRILSSLPENKFEAEGSLYATSLYFRLLRLNGFAVSQDVFTTFKDTQGGFKEELFQDVKGLLNLYEASYLAVEGEDILDEAKVFARIHLSNVKPDDTDSILYEQVIRALGLPLHFNIARLEAKWFIKAYSKRNNANLTLLEYAKLDYNMLQGSYREELILISLWWENLGVREKLPFTRDNLVEAFTWCIGMNDKPEHKYFRAAMTKLLCFLTIIDDVYDNYATLEEAQLFTDAVERWDITELEQLPEYMRVLFFAFYSTINEFAYKSLKEQGVNTLSYLRKKWLLNFKAYMLELKWFKTGYKQSLNEYLNNAAPSSTSPLLYLSSYVFISPDISTDILDYIDNTPNIIHWSAYILRLVDDLGTCKEESERGDNLKGVECYMNDAAVTEEVARKYIRDMVEVTWKKFNTEMWTDSPLPRDLVKVILDGNRITHVFYQYGDGYGHPGREMKKRISAMVFDSIPM